MLIANVAGRLHLMRSHSEGIDVAEASGGQFDADPQAIYDRWDEFVQWASTASDDGLEAIAAPDIEAPTPAPRQVFALGLNYRDHAAEVGLDIPADLTVFTKFASSFCGPIAQVKLPEGGLTDWETELIVVMGKGGRDISEADAWDHVAGITMGQDLSERRLQGAGTKQFSVAKSFKNFAPMGPVVATVDEFGNRDDIALGCSVNDVVRQDGHTRDMIFPVAEAISRLTRIVELFPGDIIWTGTPAGVGQGQKPKMIFLRPGDVVTSHMDVVGTMRQTFVD